MINLYNIYEGKNFKSIFFGIGEYINIKLIFDLGEKILKMQSIRMCNALL